MQETNEIKIITEEQQGDENLLRFFKLLLEVDRRNHPELYKKPKNKSND